MNTSDFTSNSLLAQYRPDLMHLPTTNGEQTADTRGEALPPVDGDWNRSGRKPRPVDPGAFTGGSHFAGGIDAASEPAEEPGYAQRGPWIHVGRLERGCERRAARHPFESGSPAPPARHRRVSPTQAAIHKLNIQGSSFCQRPSLTFQPPLTDGVDYSITRATSEKLSLTLKPHKKWRYEAGPLYLTSIQCGSDAPVELASGQGIVVATVLADPTIEASERELDLGPGDVFGEGSALTAEEGCEACPQGPYTDPPLLRSLPDCAAFLSAMVERNMLTFTPARGRRGDVEIFFVP